MRPPVILLAISNKGKAQEIKQLLNDLPFDLKTLDEVDIKENIEETGKTYEENAVLKAQTIGERTGMLTIGEDSGLEIDALGGWPGIKSSRHAEGTEQDKINIIIEKVKNIPEDKRSGRYTAVVALSDPKITEVKTFKGTAEGKILDHMKGRNGFGYDPIFWSKDLCKTFAQASKEEKNRVSHRARALIQLKNHLIRTTY